MTLTKELAQVLKNVGFPQVWPRPDFLEIADALKVQEIYDKYPEQFDPYRPTLSELIEACGDELFHLTQLKKNYWSVMPTNPAIIIRLRNLYPTPEEAVARLWLEIKKNNYE